MKKKAEDLKPGDVVLAHNDDGEVSARYVVVAKRRTDDYDFVITKVRIGKPELDQTFKRVHPPEDVFEVEAVESPTLSPAQQHAEELHEALAECLGITGCKPGVSFDYYEKATQSARALLARIDPPKPPTLEEALDALDAILNASCEELDITANKQAQTILDRARRSGILKK